MIHFLTCKSTLQSHKEDDLSRAKYVVIGMDYIQIGRNFLEQWKFLSLFQIGKGVCQSCILLPCFFNLYAEYIMWNARLEEAHSEGYQPWDFFGGNDAEAETPVLWPPHAKSWLIGKDPDAGRDWGQEEKGTTEDEMAQWHHSLKGCESEWTLGVGDGQGGLACCDSWGLEESDMTEWLNWT